MSENKPSPEILQPLSAVFSRLRKFSTRVRLVVAIILITNAAVAAMAYFYYARTQQTQTFLHDQLQANVGHQAEYQLQSTALSTANQANLFLNTITDKLRSEAGYFENLTAKTALFDSGIYWDAHQKLRRLSDGQWDNPDSDIGSVLVPSTVELNDIEAAKINTYIYLDFFAPELLKKDSGIIATYFVATDGVTIYYPNSDLAKIAGDFDATTQSFYQIATPEQDPQRLPVWTRPYQDPAKTGLIITNSMPVYDKQDRFLGVICIDVQLSTIATQVANLKIGENGYAFLIDSGGHIIALPNKGYSDFGIIRIAVPEGQPITQSVLGQGSEVLQAITKQMSEGKSGISTAIISGKENYIAFAPLPVTGYSLGIVAPTAELNATFINANNELDNQTRQTFNFAVVLTGALLIFAGLFSWFLGWLFTNPLNELTLAARKISAGDLSVEADGRFDDEIGTLSQAFNNMTAQLRDSIANLESRVDSRTNEITLANEKNQKQAAQLRTVADITRSAASLKNLDELLPEITQRISEGFGVYHVGIFLLDVNGEYAVLKASNSPGGQRLLLRNHRLKVGQSGIVGFVTQVGQSRIALDVGEDAVFFNNPDLPETHSELALPLSIGSDIIGALDVQSTQVAAFTNDDLDILGLLADQISITIQNARLFEETRSALLEAQNVYTQSALESWREINRQSAITGYRYANGAVEALQPDAVTPVSPANLGTRALGRGNDTLSIPINFRGQSLGALNIRQPGRTLAWRDSEIRLYQSIVERLSFALENARLYVDAQKRASKERVIGDIGAKISGSVNLDNILQTVVEELGRTLPGSEVIVQFEEGAQGAGAKSESAQ